MDTGQEAISRKSAILVQDPLKNTQSSCISTGKVRNETEVVHFSPWSSPCKIQVLFIKLPKLRPDVLDWEIKSYILTGQYLVNILIVQYCAVKNWSRTKARIALRQYHWQHQMYQKMLKMRQYMKKYCPSWNTFSKKQYGFFTTLADPPPPGLAKDHKKYVFFGPLP